MKALRFCLGGLLLIAASACGDPPPPEDPPQPVAEPEPPPPPPKPTCEAMKDRCKAEADTTVGIPDTDFTVNPPPGWEYAMLEEATVTQQNDAGAVLVLTSMETDNTAYKAKAQRTAAVKSLAELVEIDPPKKPNFASPKKRKLSGMTMTLWENSAKRGDKSGALLILTTKAGDRDIFGIGFAPTDDSEGTQAILDALETFKGGTVVDEGDGKKK